MCIPGPIDIWDKWQNSDLNRSEATVHQFWKIPIAKILDMGKEHIIVVIVF